MQSVAVLSANRYKGYPHDSQIYYSSKQRIPLHFFAFFSWNDKVKSTNAFQGSCLPWGWGRESLCHVK